MPAKILNAFLDFNKGLVMGCCNPRQQFTPTTGEAPVILTFDIGGQTTDHYATLCTYLRPAIPFRRANR